MFTSKIVLFSLACIIICALAVYAISLQMKLKAAAKESLEKDEVERLLAQKNLDKRITLSLRISDLSPNLLLPSNVS